ncbi:MAG: type II toxin-antitoxin system prevent-host-death family antitoxin [Bryobacteraceae bacterium]
MHPQSFRLDSSSHVCRSNQYPRGENPSLPAAERVAEGEEIIIGKSGKPVAKLVPYSVPKPVRKPGSLKGKIWIGPDFDTVDHETEKLFHEGPIEPRMVSWRRKPLTPNPLRCCCP